MVSNKHNVREGREILFADGKVRTIYPLTIRQLRKFMKCIKDLNITEENAAEGLEDKDIDAMVAAASIALEKVDPEVVADQDALEDVLDLKSFNLLLAAAMGADPNE